MFLGEKKNRKNNATIHKTQCFVIFGVFLDPRNYKTDSFKVYIQLTLANYPHL